MFIYNVARKLLSLFPRRRRIFSGIIILLCVVVLTINIEYFIVSDSHSRMNGQRKAVVPDFNLKKTGERSLVLEKQRLSLADKIIKFKVDNLGGDMKGQTFIGTILRQDGDQVVIRFESKVEGEKQNLLNKRSQATLLITEKKNKEFHTDSMHHTPKPAGAVDKGKTKTREGQENVTSDKTTKKSSFRIEERNTGFEEMATEIAAERSGVCPHLSLYSNQMKDVSYGTCRPHRPADSGCRFAKSLYYLEPGLRECKTEGDGNICDVKMKGQVHSFDDSSKFNVVCNRTLCAQSKSAKKNFMVTAFDPDKGELGPRYRFATFEQFEERLVDIIEETVENRFYFLFLRCKKQNGKLASQLMPIDPRITIEKSPTLRPEEALNVNILLLDSVAREHFYRSLPESIKTFKGWASDPKSAPATVFDFELFQAVEGHTAENTHALFTGKPMPPHNSDQTPPVEMEVMFGRFKESGYQTIWQEDLCYKGVWGLMNDVNAYNWRSLQGKLSDTFIDHTGITHSSCEVLSANGVESPFSGPEGDQICYNGRFQHSYFLRSVVDIVKAISGSKHAMPLFSYMSLSVGHDDRGRRIQTLDNDLVEYITELAHDNSTLTIILADHGNTYTEYTATSLEGRFEMFHPHLFFIVPNKAAKLLGPKAMSALRINQRRIVTMYDLHHTIMALASPLTRDVKPVGLFTPVRSNRTCDDIKLLAPNLCVCDGWDSPTSNDTLKLAVVEFAVGELNNLLQDKYAKSLNRTKTVRPLLMSCERIRPLRFENIRERNSKADSSLITSFDVVVHAGNVVPQNEDIFLVEIKSYELPDQRSLDMQLLNFDRLTMFGKYKQCADEGAPVKLCVCSKGEERNIARGNASKPWIKSTTFFGVAAKFKLIKSGHCIFLTRRDYNDKAFAYEIVNVCSNRKFSVSINVINLSNVKLSRAVPFTIEVFPSSVRFALSIRRSIDYWGQTHNVTAKVNTKLGHN